MIKGALIFATGASAGLALGGILGLVSGFSMGRDIKSSFNNGSLTTEPIVSGTSGGLG